MIFINFDWLMVLFIFDYKINEKFIFVKNNKLKSIPLLTQHKAFHNEQHHNK